MDVQTKIDNYMNNIMSYVEHRPFNEHGTRDSNFNYIHLEVVIDMLLKIKNIDEDKNV